MKEDLLILSLSLTLSPDGQGTVGEFCSDIIQEVRKGLESPMVSQCQRIHIVDDPLRRGALGQGPIYIVLALVFFPIAKGFYGEMKKDLEGLGAGTYKRLFDRIKKSLESRYSVGEFEISIKNSPNQLSNNNIVWSRSSIESEEDDQRVC